MVNIKIKIILQLLGSYIAQIISAFEKYPLKAAAFRNLFLKKIGPTPASFLFIFGLFK